MVNEDAKKVWAYIDEHKEEYIDLLKKYCAQPSVSAQNWGMREMAEMIRQTITELGGNGTLVETDGNPFVYGMIDNGAKRTLTLYNHYDVVPPEPYEQWNTPPFEPTIIDGRLYARGSSDNKGSLLSRYIAVDAYQKVLGKLPINIKFVAEGEEEIGSPHLMDFIRDNPEKIQSDGIIWEGGSKVVNGPLVVHMGVKGVTTFEIVCKEPKNHSNPVWRLIWALNSMKNVDDYITVDHFNDSIAPLTEYERSFALNNDYDEEAMKKMNGIDHFVRNLTGNALKEKLYTEPSMNIQGLFFHEIDPSTGMPKSAAVKMDIRTVPNQEPEELMRQLRNHLDARGFEDLEIIEGHSTLPYRGKPDSLLARAVIKDVAEVYGMPADVHLMIPGSCGMARVVKATGIPIVHYGCMDDASRAHAPNESVDLDHYIKGAKLSVLVFQNFATMD